MRLQEAIPVQWAGFSTGTPTKDPLRGRYSRGGVAPSGLSANSRVETLRGAVAARDLQIGDQVKTYDGSFAELRWVGTSRPLMNNDLPMRRQNADGSDSTTLLTPEHLVLIEDDRCIALFGRRDVLCPAKYLAANGHYAPDADVNPVFVHLLFDSYVLVKSGEDWVESLSPDMDQIRIDDQDTAQEITRHLPRLASLQGLASYVQTRPVLDAREADLLFQ